MIGSPNNPVIVFMGDKVFENRSIIMYDIKSDEYQILPPSQNYVSIDVKPFDHCIFLHKSKDDNNEYIISFDQKHIAYLNCSLKRMSLLKLIETDDCRNMFQTDNATCLQLNNDS